MVKKIYYLYLNGYGVNKIAKELEVVEKVPTKRGGTWSGSHVAGILQNSIYTGHTTLHRTRKQNINTGIIEKIPEDKQIKLDDESLRIISDETFNEAQLQRDSRPKVKNMLKGVDSRYSNAHLFSNLLRCVNCGGTMRKKVQKTKRQTHHYYYCRNHEMYGYNVCKYRNLQREEDLLEWVKEEFRTFINDAKGHEENLKMMIEARYEGEDYEKLINELEVRLEEIRKEKDAIIRLYSKEIITEDEFRERNDNLNVESDKAKAQIRRYQNVNEEIELLHDKYIRFLNDLKQVNLEKLDNVTLKKFIISIDICTMWIPGEGEDEQLIRSIVWRFMDTDELSIIDEHVKKFVIDKQPNK
ncbi:Recombinase [compost metagenome]